MHHAPSVTAWRASDAAHEDAHAAWRARQPAWVRALDRMALTPWWRAYRLRARPDGNSLDIAWMPRPGGIIWAAALYGGLLALGWLMTLMALPPGSPALLNARLPPAISALRAVLRGNVPGLATSQAALACVYALIFSNAAFAFTSFVTTYRRSAWRGLHGDLRDITVVNVVGAPWLAVASLRPMAGAFFQGEGVLAAPLANASITDPLFAHAWALVSLGGALFPLAAFVAGAAVGLNVAYIVRAGCCSASISSEDIARASCSQRLGVAMRLALIAFFASVHIAWLHERGAAGTALLAYAAAAAALSIAAYALRERYYFHWHHWAAGLMLVPLARTGSPALSAMLLGVLAAQHIDGACRFSCAPLFHRRPGCADMTGYS